MTIFAPVRMRLVYIRICLNVTVCISWKNLSLYHYRRSRTQMTVSYDSSYFDCFKSLYEFLSNSSIANSPYSNQLEYYYSYLVKTAISNELKKANSVPLKTKLNHIREICTFADEKRFLSIKQIFSPCRFFPPYVLQNL